jgi:hypothetical protein
VSKQVNCKAHRVERRKKMKVKSMFPSLTVLVALSTVPSWAAEAFISKAATSVANYCHLKFPAIQEETLYWDRPVLRERRIREENKGQACMEILLKNPLSLKIREIKND